MIVVREVRSGENGDGLSIALRSRDLRQALRECSRRTQAPGQGGCARRLRLLPLFAYRQLNAALCWKDAKQAVEKSTQCDEEPAPLGSSCRRERRLPAGIFFPLLGAPACSRLGEGECRLEASAPGLGRLDSLSLDVPGPGRPDSLSTEVICHSVAGRGSGAAPGLPQRAAHSVVMHRGLAQHHGTPRNCPCQLRYSAFLPRTKSRTTSH